MNFLFIFLIVMAETIAALGECPTIISKNRWGGQLAQSVTYTLKPVKNVIIHHTSTPTCRDEGDCSRRLVNMQSYHMEEKDFDDIGYNFLIGGDAQIYEGGGWHRQGAHTYGWNSKSVGIAYVGDFTSDAPSREQLEAGKQLIQCGVDLKEIDERYRLFGARTLRPTDSPGTALFREIQNWRGFTRRA